MIVYGLLALTLLTAVPFVRHHPNCQVAERGNMVAGKRDGLWTTWSPSGAKTSEGSYVRGLREGVWTYYSDTGMKQTSGPFVKDLAEGTFGEYSISGAKWRDVVMQRGQRVAPEAKACVAKHGRWVVDYAQREEGCAIDNKREGLWTTYHDDGSKKSIGAFRKHKLNGKLTEWHPNGALFHEGDYVDGLPTGLHRFLGQRGEVFGESTITSGTGNWVRYSPEGKLAEDFVLKNGGYDGPWRLYFDNGAIKEDVMYVNNQTHGVFRAWHPNGALKWKGLYEKDQRSGEWFGWYTNNQPQFTGLYLNDHETGTWSYKTWAGQPLASGEMEYGQRASTWSLHEDDGTLQRTGPYRYGKMNGRWKEFWATGEPWREVEYLDDLEASDAAAACAREGGKWVRDGSARRLGCEVCKPEPDDSISIVGVGVWQWWFPNGALEREGSLAQGKPVGNWKTYFDNGQLKTRGAYAAGKEQGEWVGYYRDGQVRFRGRYKDGLAEGEWESFHSNGKTLSRGSYTAGKRMGPWVYFDRDGKREEKEEAP